VGVTGAPPRAAARGGRSRWRLYAAAAVVSAALAVLLLQGLGQATLYFYNADEAVARRDDLGDRRFRLQGTVVDGSVRQTQGEVDFAVAHGAATVPVRHQGDPPDLFRADIPVVLEGAFEGSTFVSDRIMVKHTSEYRAEHPERVPATTAP
jgi:cytochrome c-type biogenesis protein CcmE